MPPRAKVYSLPVEVAVELERRLISSCFRDLKGHEAWLRGQGYNLGREAVRTYGKLLRRKRYGTEKGLPTVTEMSEHARGLKFPAIENIQGIVADTKRTDAEKIEALRHLLDTQGPAR